MLVKGLLLLSLSDVWLVNDADFRAFVRLE